MKIEISEYETENLIKNLPFGVPLPLAFGVGHVWLKVKDAHPETVKLLARLRGVTFEEGSGI